MEAKKYKATITLKGIAVVAAIGAGLCPEVNGEIDTDAFEKFWAQFEPDMHEWMKRYLENQSRKTTLNAKEQFNMESKTLWEQLKSLCLTQAIDILSGEHCPNVACVEIAERLANIVVAIDRHNLQAQGVEGIKQISEFCNSVNEEMEK